MGEASRGRNRQTRKLDSSLGGHQDCGGGLEKGRVRSSRPGCTDRMDGQAHPTSQILGLALERYVRGARREADACRTRQTMCEWPDQDYAISVGGSDRCYVVPWPPTGRPPDRPWGPVLERRDQQRHELPCLHVFGHDGIVGGAFRTAHGAKKQVT